jgi:hypothetical protein
MDRLLITPAFLIPCILLCTVEPAQAQIPGYRPTRPTLSPYFDLYRFEPGPLGGYLSDFRPRQEVRQALQRQSARVQQQSATIRSLDRRMSLVEGPVDLVRPTGTGSGFMNYSHYYLMRGRARSSGSRRSWSAPSARTGGSYGGF